MTTDICYAADRNTCRNHGATKYAPKNSIKAEKALHTANKAIKSSHNEAEFFANKENEAKAQNDYNVTKKGIQSLSHIAEEWNNKVDEAIRSNSTELVSMQEKSYEAQNNFQIALSNRQAMLENYSEALVDNEFYSESDKDKAFARLAMLNNFAKLELEGELEFELNRDGCSVTEFYEKLSDPNFTARVSKIEKTFYKIGHESKNEKDASVHGNIRSEIANNENIEDLLIRADFKTQESLLT